MTDYLSGYRRALHDRRLAMRAAGRSRVAAIEAGIVSDRCLLPGFSAVSLLALAPVAHARKIAALKAYRAVYPAPVRGESPV